MALLTEEQRKAFNLIIPFGIAGYVFYAGYAKKGKENWQSAGAMAFIVFVCCYIVTTQTTRLLSSQEHA